MLLPSRRLVLALGLALLLSSAAGAEDEAQPEPVPPSGEEPMEAFPEKAPPRLERSAAAYRAPADRPDLVEYVKALRRNLAEYEKPAPRSGNVTALHDAWSRILKPRARRMTKRLERWEERKRWLHPPGESKPVGLEPDQWTQFTRDMASLGTELHGAWTQYGTVRLREKRVGFGQATLPKPPRVTRFGYGRPVHRGGIRTRQLAGWGMGRYDMGSYWHLLNNFYSAWNWRYARRAEYDQWRRKQAQARKQAFQQLRTELNNTRESLAENMLGLQALVGAMQNSEEERLAREFMALPEDDTLREMVELGLREMEPHRLDAETFDGRRSSEYGSLLRKWLRIQKAGGKLLEYVKSEVEKGEPEEEAATEEEPGGDER